MYLDLRIGSRVAFVADESNRYSGCDSVTLLNRPVLLACASGTFPACAPGFCIAKVTLQEKPYNRLMLVKRNGGRQR
jgi:hypothetical protein